MKLSAPGLEPGTYGLKVPNRGFDWLRSNLVRDGKTQSFGNKIDFRLAYEKCEKRPSEVLSFSHSFSHCGFGPPTGREVERVLGGMKTGERGTSIPEFLCEVNSNSAENYYRQCVTLRTELLGPLRSSGPDTSFDLRGFRVFFACTTDRNVRGNRGQSGNGPHHSAETAAGNLQGSGGCCVRRGPFHPSEIGTAYLTHKRVQCLYRSGNPSLFSGGNVPGLVKLRTKPSDSSENTSRGGSEVGGEGMSKPHHRSAGAKAKGRKNVPLLRPTREGGENPADLANSQTAPSTRTRKTEID